MTTEQLRQKELSVIEHFKNAASDGCVCDVCNAVRDYTTTQSLLREDEARVFKENNIKLYGELEKAEQDAAAQLAEKEREIINLKSDAFEADLELTAAEQRLQEATERPFCEGCDHGVTDGGLCELCEGTGYKERRNPPHLGKRLQEAQADVQHWQARYVTQQNLCWSFRDGLAELRERLRQREAELEQRWIAVEERLPDEPQHDVLLWTADDWESNTNFQQIGIIGEFNRDEWDGKVTHWQPLPSPPKEAKVAGEDAGRE